MAKIEYDSKALRLTFECLECGSTAEDPDRIGHMKDCSVAIGLEKSNKIKAMSDALIHACNDLGVDLHQCDRWPGSISIASRMYDELNKK